MSKPRPKNRKPRRDPVMLQAIEIAGGATRVAERLGILQSAVSQWTRVPAERLMRVSQLSGVAPELLRPDMFECADA